MEFALKKETPLKQTIAAIYKTTFQIYHSFASIPFILSLQRRVDVGKRLWQLLVLSKTGDLIDKVVNYYIVLLDTLDLAGSKSAIIKLRDGLKIKVRLHTSDIGVLFDIFINNTYKLESKEFNAGDVIIDVGGHIGCTSLFLSELNKKGKIFIIEPESANFHLLQENIKLNNKTGSIFPYNLAIGKTNGYIKLYLSHNNAGHTFLLKSSEIEEKTQKVKMTTLQDFVDSHGIKKIALLKLDCERAEYDILETSLLVLKKVENIVLEYHDLDEKRNSSYLIQLLRDNGFKTSMSLFPNSVIYGYRTKNKTS